MFTLLERGLDKITGENWKPRNAAHQAQSRTLFYASRALLRDDSEISNKPIRSVLVRTTTVPVWVNGRFSSLSVYGRVFHSNDFPSEIFLRLQGQQEYMKVWNNKSDILEAKDSAGEVVGQDMASADQIKAFSDVVFSAGIVRTMGEEVEKALVPA